MGLEVSAVSGDIGESMFKHDAVGDLGRDWHRQMHLSARAGRGIQDHVLGDTNVRLWTSR